MAFLSIKWRKDEDMCDIIRYAQKYREKVKGLLLQWKHRTFEQMEKQDFLKELLWN